MIRIPYSTRHFVWLHTPKTGGTWLYRILTKLAPPGWMVSYGPPAHVRLSEVEDALRKVGHGERVELPYLAHVRNPWDWYVSLYFFMEQHYVNRTGGFSVPMAEWSPGCTSWHTTYSRGNSIAGFREALPVMLSRMHVMGDASVAPPQEAFLRGQDGSLGVRPVRFERLREELLTTIESTGAAIPRAMRSTILQRARENTSGHAPYVRCYTPGLRDLVRLHDAWLIDTIGYEFDR